MHYLSALALSRNPLVTAVVPSRPAFVRSARLFNPSLLASQRVLMNATNVHQYQLQRRAFHVTLRKEAPFPLLLGLLKSGATLGTLTTVTRVVVSILPLHIFGFIKSKRKLQAWNPNSVFHAYDRPAVSERALEIFSLPVDDPLRPPRSQLGVELQRDLDLLDQWDLRRLKHERRLERARKAIIWTIAGPVLVFILVVVTGLERVPLTGRWRVVLISPAEEAALHTSLEQQGWFQSVLDVLMPNRGDPNAPPSPPVAILPPDDWRWTWVESTLRRIEQAAIEDYSRHCALQEKQHSKCSVAGPTNGYTFDESKPFPPPPPTCHPLHPRPRASQVLFEFNSCESMCWPGSSKKLEAEATAAPAALAPRLDGPPYELLLLDSTEQNAFSHGFGRVAGIVVYSGLLDEILRTTAGDTAMIGQEAHTPSPRQKSSRSLISYFFPSSLLSPRTAPSSSASSPSHFQPPTEAQTLHLAAVLAHEMSHLLLSHHLETLSYSNVVLPSAMNLGADLLRTVLFPFTMVFGPFVNDAISNVFRVGSSEIKNIHETCSSQIMEVEADLVGLRLLALAGFNPFDAQRFWSPVHPPTPSHVSTTLTNKPVPPGRWRAAIDAAGGRKSHPEDEARVQAVRRELERWREEWRKLGERTAKMAA